MAFTIVGDGTARSGAVHEAGQGNAQTALETLPGLDLIVRFGQDGVVRGKASYDEETVAAEGLLVGQAGERLAELFGIGKLISAGIESPGRNVLLLKGRDEYLGALGTAEPPRKMEERVKAALAPRKGRGE